MSSRLENKITTSLTNDKVYISKFLEVVLKTIISHNSKA